MTEQQMIIHSAALAKGPGGIKLKELKLILSVLGFDPELAGLYIWNAVRDGQLRKVGPGLYVACYYHAPFEEAQS
jgi:hypothetical protein